MRWIVGAALGFFAACFTPPDSDVLFSCEPDSAPTCPEKYTCEVDGCCHRDGSDVEASFGACRLTATSITETSPTTGTSGSSGGTDSGTSTGGSTSATTSTTETSGSSGSTDDTGDASSSSG